MKRFHVHVGVRDLQQSVRFYSALFAAEPTVLKDDYAKVYGEDRGAKVEQAGGCCAPKIAAAEEKKSCCS